MDKPNINLFSIKKKLNKKQRLETLKKALESLGLKYKPQKEPPNVKK